MYKAGDVTICRYPAIALADPLSGLRSLAALSLNGPRLVWERYG